MTSREIILISADGHIAFTKASSFSCGIGAADRPDLNPSLMIDKIAEGFIHSAQKLSDYFFFTVTDNKLRLFNSNVKLLLLSHDIREGYFPLDSRGNIFMKPSDENDEETIIQKENTK